MLKKVLPQLKNKIAAIRIHLRQCIGLYKRREYIGPLGKNPCKRTEYRTKQNIGIRNLIRGAFGIMHRHVSTCGWNE